MNEKRIAVIGAGMMGSVVIKSLLENGHPKTNLSASTRTSGSAEQIASELGIETSTNNTRAAENADVIILSVKPIKIRSVVSELASAGRLQTGTLVVSIAAGVHSATIEESAGEGVSVVRAMPNLPCAIGCGMTVISRGTSVSDEQIATARALFVPMGRVAELEEKHMDTVTGLSASGPAFLYVIIEALADGAVARGLPRKVAIEMAAQIAFGAGSMVLETGSHPAALKDEVTTPAGCTIAGILALEDGRIRSVLSRAVEVASVRAGELGRGSDGSEQE